MNRLRRPLLFCLWLFLFSAISISPLARAQEAGAPELALQLGHSFMVHAVAFSPDGTTLASGGESVKLWNVRSGLLLHTLEASGGIYTLAWSPDGAQIVGAGSYNPGKIWFWDAKSGQLLRTITGHSGQVCSIAFSPDGSTLASGSTDNTIKLWDARSGELKGDLGGHDDFVNAVAWSPDGQWIASGGQDTVVKIWDAKSGQLRRSWKVFETTEREGAGMCCIAFSPDSQTLAAGGGDGVVRLWDAGGGQLRRALSGHTRQVSSLAFSPDGTALLSASADNSLKVWDLQSGVLRRDITGVSRTTSSIHGGGSLGYGEMKGKTSSKILTANCVAVSPDGQWIANGSYDRSVKLWQAENSDLRNFRISRGQQDSSEAAFSPDGRHIAGSSGDEIRLCDSFTGELLRVLGGHSFGVSSLAFSPDGRTLLSGGHDKTARLWDIASGQLLRVFAAKGGVTTVAWSPDGHTVAAGSAGMEGWDIQFWNAASGVLQSAITGAPADNVYALRWSPDGRAIAAAMMKKHALQVWDAQSGALLKTLVGPNDYMWSLAWSPDGRTLAGGGGSSVLSDKGNSIVLWDAQSGAVRQTLRGHESYIWSLDFSSDGYTLASAAWDKTIKLWDARSGETIRTLLGHSRHVGTIAWSPDNKRLLSAASDSTTRLWNAASGQLLGTLLSLPEVGDTTLAARPIEIGAKAIEIGAKAAQLSNNEWFVVTPEGYFDCSANAALFIRWRVGEQLFPAERYYRKFRRPDLVQASLRGEKIAAPQMTGEDVPPEAHFVSLKYTGDAAAKAQKEVLVTLEARGKRDITEVLLLVNGRPLPPESEKPISTSDAAVNLSARPLDIGAKPIEIGAKALDIGAKAIEIGAKPITVDGKPAGSTPGASTPDAQTSYRIAKRYTFRVVLPVGATEIKMRAVAYDAGQLGSSPAEIRLNNSSAKVVSGRLFALCVGISRYARGKASTPGPPIKGQISNLKYPAIDAQSLSARLKEEGAPLYEKVEVKTLTDEQATLPNIRAALKWLQASARPGQIDTVVLCLSGHGLSDSQGRYFFPTFEFDPENHQKTSLSGSELQEELGGKLRAKDVFLFVDTCHSGALAGARSDDLNFEVNSSGVYMMASSGASQYSYESSDWGHGAFTYALLRSLAKKELAQGGVIHFNVLTYAVPDEIARLLKQAGQSEDAMAPVVPLEGRFLDAPVARAQ